MFHDDAGACMSPGFFIPYKEASVLDIRVIIQIGSLSTSEVNASCLMGDRLCIVRLEGGKNCWIIQCLEEGLHVD